MYRIILISLLGLWFIPSQAQSKTETIQWINSKLQTNGTTPFKYFDSGGEWGGSFKDLRPGVSGGFTIVKTKDEAGYILYTTVDYNRIISAKKWSMVEDGPFIWLEGKFSMRHEGKTAEVTTAARVFLPWSYEPNLLERMLKAFQHLAELNSGKETF